LNQQESLIQPDSPIPLYKQLESIILQEIEGMSEGDMLPAEREFQEKYHVSRATVRTSLNEIEQLGWIKRIQGVGTVVSKPTIQPEILKLTSFTEDIRARGLLPGSKNIDLTLVIPPQVVASALKLQADSKVIYVKRLRLADNQPVGIHKLYIPPHLEFSPTELNKMGSYYALLRERHNLEPSHAIERLTAKNADEQEAKLLDTPVGVALLAIERTTYTADSAVLEYVSLVYRADRYEYQVTLYRE
jgi:GntR family transcriptional regulator